MGNGQSNDRPPQAGDLPNGHSSAPAPEIIERELKLLTKDGSPDPFYVGVTPFLFKHKMLVHSAPSRHLITSQRDTEGLELLKHGVTLRLRTTCTDSKLDKVGATDICVKIPHDKAGGLAREEYEAEQKDFLIPDPAALRAKYPPSDPQNAGLHKFLDMTNGKNLIEYFRIDVMRERHIIKIPNKAVGLRDDQAFYGELLYDRIRYVIDDEGMDEPIVLNPHCELELEPLNKQCIWNTVPNGDAYICKNLTQEDKINCLHWFRDFVMNDNARGHFVQTFKGKAERGFEVLMSYADFIERHPQLLNEKKMKSLFNHRSSAADQNQDTLLVIARPEDISQSDHPVALRPPPQPL